MQRKALKRERQRSEPSRTSGAVGSALQARKVLASAESVQQRDVRKERARSAPADLAAKAHGDNIPAAWDGKVTRQLMPLPAAAFAPDDQQSVPVEQFPKCQLVECASHALTISTGARTFQERRADHDHPRLRGTAAIRHKLATSSKMLPQTLADFCGFQRVVDLWQKLRFFGCYGN